MLLACIHSNYAQNDQIAASLGEVHSSLDDVLPTMKHVPGANCGILGLVIEYQVVG